MAAENPALQGHNNWSNDFYTAFKFWDAINNYAQPPPQGPRPPEPRKADIRAAYNASQAVPFTIPDPAIAVPPPANPQPLPAVVRPRSIPLLAPDVEPEEQKYLKAKRYPHRYGGHRGDWSAVKILGSGTGGVVVLWEWVGPAARAPRQTKVAVKGAWRLRNKLTDEGDVMQELGVSRSEHIVKLLVPKYVLTPNMCTRRGISDLWVGRTWQLVMEYCPGGTLDTLLDMRKERNIRFEELTLWLIFECLVDACSVLEYGMELGYDEVDQTAFVPAAYDPARSLTTVVHRDLKPSNVFAGRRSRSHGDVQVFKFGDFGTAQHWQKVFANNPDPWRHGDYEQYHSQVRRQGTRGYYTPESFHPGWNNNDFQVSNICGKFGSHTNIWQMGAIMYELACFNLGTPEVHLPFTPGHNINGAPPLGRLYGTQLRNQPGLSNELKDTIHECLYEDPQHRADLVTLKSRIRSTLDTLARNPASRAEGLQNVECDEPLTGAQDALPAFLIMRKQCTALLKRPHNPRCKLMVDVRRNNDRPRCRYHWDLREYQRL